MACGPITKRGKTYEVKWCNISEETMSMKQLRIFPLMCPAEDDRGTKCQVEMTDEETEQDGMCTRCAESIYDSMQRNTEFFYDS